MLLPPCRSSEKDYSTCRNKKHVTATDHLSLSFYLVLHFLFFHSLFERFHSGEWNTFTKTSKKIVLCLVGIFLHRSGPGWLTPNLPCHQSVYPCVFCVSFQLSLRPFTYFPPKKITASIQKSEVQVDGWKSKCREAVWSTVTSRRRAWLRTLYYLSEYKIEHTDMRSCLIAKNKK